MSHYQVTRIAHVDSDTSEPDWLIEQLWASGAVGFIAGHPKGGKTWLALELAVAVASGRPCLGCYRVLDKGVVILYAAEDSARAIKQRVCDIAKARSIHNIAQLPLGLITETGLLLDHPEHQQRLLETVEHYRPRLLLLDPLVRIHSSDENSARDISSLLAFLREMQRQLKVAIILVHHVRKSATNLPGLALRGSGDLHAWADSALYLIRQKEGLELQVEHRSLPSPAPIQVALNREPSMHLSVLDQETPSLPGTPERLLADDIIAALTNGPMSRTALRDKLAIRNERLGPALANLEKAGLICRSSGLIAVVPSSGTSTGTGTNYQRRNGK